MSFTIYMTGLPGAGKSVIAQGIKSMLDQHVVVLDGDVVFEDLSSDLDHSEAGRTENTRRIMAVCRILNNNGIIAVVPTCIPLESLRRNVKRDMGDLVEFMFIHCDQATCELRKPAGYEKARAGIFKDYPGVDTPFEAPVEPEYLVNTTCHPEHISIINAVTQILARHKHLTARSYPSSP